MALYCAVVLIDLIFTVCTIVDAIKQNRQLLVEGSSHKGVIESPSAVFTFIAVEVANFAVYAFAAFLKYKEYVRMMTEAWYAHKLFIWSSLVLHVLHLAIFFPLYSPLRTTLCLLKISIFFAILVTMVLTRPRKSIDRVNSNMNTAISRSNTLYLNVDSQSDDKTSMPVSTPKGSNMTYNGPYYSKQLSKKIALPKMSKVCFDIKILKMQRKNDDYNLNFQTMVRQIPRRVKASQQ